MRLREQGTTSLQLGTKTNFILYQFQNRNLKHPFVNATQTFEIDIEQNLHFC